MRPFPAQLGDVTPRLPPWCELSLSLHSGLILSFCGGASVAGLSTGCVFQQQLQCDRENPGPRHPRSSAPIADRTVATLVQSAGAGQDWAHSWPIVRH